MLTRNFSSIVLKHLAIPGALTYIYALFYRFGLIDVPEEAKESMEPMQKKTEFRREGDDQFG